MKLEFKAEARPQGRGHALHGGVRPGAEVPKAQEEAQRKRLEKEREQLAKNIANSERQLSDETFLSKAPAKVVESIRQKLADYEAQLRKIDDCAMIAEIVRRALEEDIGTGDVTTSACVPESRKAQRAVSGARSRWWWRVCSVLRLIYDDARRRGRADAAQARWRPRARMARPSPRCAGAPARCSNASAWRSISCSG